MVYPWMENLQINMESNCAVDVYLGVKCVEVLAKT